MFHVSAYSGSIAQNAYVDVPAVQDDILTIVNNHFQLFDNLFALALWAGSVNLDRVRLASASFRQINQPFIIPVEAAAVPASYPRLSSKVDAPLRLPVGEEIAFEGFQTSAGAQLVNIITFMGKDLASIPQGDVVTARMTGTTAAVANKWTSITLAYDQALPSGLYAMIGSYHQSATALAHRWIIPNQVMRPGELSRQASADIPHPAFSTHRMGEFGRFLNTTPPILQAFCNAADAVHTVYQELVKIG